ncbi:MAG TPA: response regulator, partial [Acidimicrobiales bacterium]|nr:response regulator [Acidimicrobiales bacterium]
NEETDGGAPTAPPPHHADRVRLSVTDTGPGIADDETARLFEPFERLDAAARGIDGTGVGLALSKTLTEAMGGEVGVQSTVGEGSTFWCDFDRADAAAPPAAPATERAGTDDRPPTKDGSIVLYVEDDVANQHLISRVLRDRPEHLEVVAEGRRALDFARRVRPAAVLLAVHLPDMHGYDVLTRLKADPATADIPVVIVSADATRHTREQLTRAGADRYLTKPVDVNELRDVLDRLARETARPAISGTRSPT